MCGLCAPSDRPLLVLLESLRVWMVWWVLLSGLRPWSRFASLLHPIPFAVARHRMAAGAARQVHDFLFFIFAMDRCRCRRRRRPLRAIRQVGLPPGRFFGKD